MLPSCASEKADSAAEATDSKTAATAADSTASVGVAKVGTKDLQRDLTVSAELVPFQEIDVYAKESGFVKELNVDYGTRVKQGQVMAVLEIPELQLQLQEDDAAIKHAEDVVNRSKHELERDGDQQKVADLQYHRLDDVAKTKPGLVAQQEVDDAEGKYLAAEAQVEAAQAALEAAQSELQVTQAKKGRDQVLFDYSKITAPFAGVVTQRYANQGTLMQAGTSSSTQALPLVKLSEDDLFRLVIPVPESYVRYIHIGDPARVVVGSLGRTFEGKVTRFSVDVKEDTRTMHTEVDVPNPDHTLVPGLYAEATLSLERRKGVLAAPLQAIDRQGELASVYVVDASNKVAIRPVTLGVETDTDAEIVSGLKEGDLVIISDRSGLKAGQSVKPKVVEPAQNPGSNQN